MTKIEKDICKTRENITRIVRFNLQRQILMHGSYLVSGFGLSNVYFCTVCCLVNVEV